MRFITMKTTSRAEIEAEVLPRFLSYYARYPDFGHWAADLRGNGEFIGWFGLRPVRAAGAAMVDWVDAPLLDTLLASLAHLPPEAWRYDPQRSAMTSSELSGIAAEDLFEEVTSLPEGHAVVAETPDRPDPDHVLSWRQLVTAAFEAGRAPGRVSVARAACGYRVADKRVLHTGKPPPGSKDPSVASI
jgi:hypothetical protein